jgi:hypothetical protein
VRLELARPGESKRIVHVLDTIHPLPPCMPFRESTSPPLLSGRAGPRGCPIC